MPCSKCGESGHYASTCGKKPRAKKPSGAQTVLEQLRARRDQIRHQLEGVQRLQRDLEVVESTIDQLAEIEGGA